MKAGQILLAAALAGAPFLAAANTSVGVSVSVNQPGFYGRIDIGHAPPPAVIYPQPVIIAPPAVIVHQTPVYMRVPPGHAKNWGKHCHKYNACSRPVYFVKYDEDRERQYWEEKKKHGKGGPPHRGRDDHPGKGPKH
ncbi:hypothetical protein [Caldimonas caldifontis]|uniref:Lipoprotein n=1 Tax=Caldimonas caldifontis TaxID=1452508 RepID=A0A2S5SRS2_9BURK|nr:hypothetical protein [Caldimonas caldifontis]PPE65432.1 hypothetical protein C1704_14350 [Caldimonas caldifontis]